MVAHDFIAMILIGKVCLAMVAHSESTCYSYIFTCTHRQSAGIPPPATSSQNAQGICVPLKDDSVTSSVIKSKKQVKSIWQDTMAQPQMQYVTGHWPLPAPA